MFNDCRLALRRLIKTPAFTAAVLAAYLPAKRASRTDPAAVLRSE